MKSHYRNYRNGTGTQSYHLLIVVAAWVGRVDDSSFPSSFMISMVFSLNILPPKLCSVPELSCTARPHLGVPLNSVVVSPLFACRNRCGFLINPIRNARGLNLVVPSVRAWWFLFVGREKVCFYRFGMEF